MPNGPGDTGIYTWAWLIINSFCFLVKPKSAQNGSAVTANRMSECCLRAAILEKHTEHPIVYQMNITTGELVATADQANTKAELLVKILGRRRCREIITSQSTQETFLAKQKINKNKTVFVTTTSH